jgi:hypothetical protein
MVRVILDGSKNVTRCAVKGDVLAAAAVPDSILSRGEFQHVLRGDRAVSRVLDVGSAIDLSFPRAHRVPPVARGRSSSRRPGTR